MAASRARTCRSTSTTPAGRARPAARSSTPSATTSRARARTWRRYLLTLDAINFGSGWFPTLRKRPGCSGYFTVAWALADRFREHGPWSNAELRADRRRRGGGRARPGAGPRADGPVRRGAARARRFLGERSALDVVADAGGSAERLAEALAAGMPFFDDRASTSAPRSRRTTWRSRASPSSPTSTGSRSSPTTSCRTCCAWTACCATTRAGRPHRRRRAAPARPRGDARSAPAPSTPAS